MSLRKRPVAVRLKPGWHPVVLPSGRVLQPGEVTDEVTPEEAGQREDFEVVEVVEKEGQDAL